MVVLENVSRRIWTGNVPKAILPELSTRQVVATTVSDPKTGDVQVQAKRAMVSGSLTIRAGAKSVPLSNAVLRAPEVSAAVGAGILKTHVESDSKAAPAEPPKDPPKDLEPPKDDPPKDDSKGAPKGAKRS